MDNPETLQRTLRALWQEILEVEHIGPHDNFFECGGDSVRALMMISRIGQGLDFDVALRTLFDTPTIAEWAPRLPLGPAAGTSAEADDAPDEPADEPSRSPAWFAALARDLGDPIDEGRLPPRGPSRGGGAPPLSFEQEDYYLDFLRGRIPRRVPLAFRIRGALDVEALARTLDEMVRRHEVLRTTIGLVDGRVSQIIHDDFRLVLHRGDLRAATDQAAALTEERVAAARICGDPERGPVVWAKLLLLAPEEHVLLVTVNHIAFDGWSMEVVAQECTKLYEAFRQGQPSPLEPPRMQYTDYARWRRRHMRGAVLERHVAYWHRALVTADFRRLELPALRPRQGSAPTTACLQLEIDTELVAGMKALAARNAVTLFSTMLAAFSLVLARAGGQSDVTLGTIFANRNSGRLTGLVGNLATLGVLRLMVEGRLTVSQLIIEAHRTVIGAQEHQSLPQHRILASVGGSSVETERARDAIYPRSFFLLFTHSPWRYPQPPGLEIEALPETDEIILAAGCVFYETDDLSAVWTETSSGRLEGSLSYRSDLFSRDFVNDLLARFDGALRAFVAQPDATVDELLLDRPVGR